MSFFPSANAVRKEMILGAVSGIAALTVTVLLKKYLAKRKERLNNAA